MKNKRELAEYLRTKLKLPKVMGDFIHEHLIKFEDGIDEKIINKEVDSYFEETETIDKNTAYDLAKRVFEKGKKQ